MEEQKDVQPGIENTVVAANATTGLTETIMDAAGPVFTISGLATHLQSMASTAEGADRAALNLSVTLLRRRLEFEIDSQLCSECGFAEFDPCEDADTGACSWAGPGLCSSCVPVKTENGS